MSRTIYTLVIMSAVYSAKSMSNEHCAMKIISGKMKQR